MKNKQARSKHGKKWEETHRRRNLFALYGLTIEVYDEMVTEQGGVCAICQKPPHKNGRLHVDHHHRTGRIRSLLCVGCNVKLGTVENTDWMAKANAYLRVHETRHLRAG